MSREDVIRRIVDRDNRKLGLTEEIVRQEDAVLFGSACEEFGTWDTALRYAGVNVQRVARERRSSAEAVTHQICRLCYDARVLEGKHIRRFRPLLHKAALKHFGSWEQAMKAAGIRPENVFRYAKDQQPSKEEITAMLLYRQQQGLSLRRVDMVRENYALVKATKSMFGSWTRTLIEAGILEDCAVSRNIKWTRDRVIREIQMLHEPADGRPIGKTRNVALTAAARRQFGTWRNALLAAGIVTEKAQAAAEVHPPVEVHRPKWSRQRVLDAIRERHKEGKPLTCKSLRADNNALRRAAEQCFGSWGRAIAAAGLDAGNSGPGSGPGGDTPPILPSNS